MLEKDGPCYPHIDQVMPAVAEALGITVEQLERQIAEKKARDGVRFVVERRHERLMGRRVARGIALARRRYDEFRRTIELGESVVASALRTEDGRIFTSPTHIENLLEAREVGAPISDDAEEDFFSEDFGFLTSTGRFVSRDEAEWVAEESEQNTTAEEPALNLLGTLCSERLGFSRGLEGRRGMTVDEMLDWLDETRPV